MASNWVRTLILALACGGGLAQLRGGGGGGDMQKSANRELSGAATKKDSGAKTSLPAKDALTSMLDEGEVPKKSKKGAKKRTMSGPELAAKEKKKSMGEKEVKVDVKELQKLPLDSSLGDGEAGDGKGTVAKVLEKAKKRTAEERAAQKAANKGRGKKGSNAGTPKKTLSTRKHDEYDDDDESKNPPDNEKMLKISTCEKVDNRVAFLVPTAGVELERTAALVISFDRMGYSHDLGDLKLVFSNAEALEHFEKKMPRFLKDFQADDVPYHRLMVEIKDNAIVLDYKETAEAQAEGVARGRRGLAAGSDTQPGGTPGSYDWETQRTEDLRAFQARERLLALAHIMDTQPCAYKYAALTPPEGRFFVPEKAARKDVLASIKGGLTPGGKAKGPTGRAKKGLVGIEMLDGKSIESIEKEHKDDAKEKKAPKAKKAKKAKKLFGIFRRSLLGREADEDPAAAPPRAGGKGAKTGRPKTAAAKEAAAVKAEKKGDALAIFNAKFERGTIWAQSCDPREDGSAPSADSALVQQRMEGNALLFSGLDTQSPRYKRLEKETSKFQMHTLQADLAIIHLKHDGVQFLLEVFRASLAAPKDPYPTTLRGLMDATFDQYPMELMPMLSDVLLLHYYHLLRNGYKVSVPTSVAKLANCAEAPGLLAAGGRLSDKHDRLTFGRKTKPLLVSESFADGADSALMKIDPAFVTGGAGPY